MTQIKMLISFWKFDLEKSVPHTHCQTIFKAKKYKYSGSIQNKNKKDEIIKETANYSPITINL